MKTPPIPFSTLLAGLADPGSQARKHAITAIMRRRKERGQAFASLLTSLSDPEDQVRTAALKALGTLGDPRAIPALAQMLTEQSARLRLLALLTLLQVDQKQAFLCLLAALHDQNVSVRRKAAIALRNMGDTRCVPPFSANVQTILLLSYTGTVDWLPLLPLLTSNFQIRLSRIAANRGFLSIVYTIR